VGPKVFKKESSKFLNKEHLVRAQKFYDKHGKVTIILARFIPIIRTFAPFVAGIGIMSYPIFLAYNLIGGILWTTLFVMGGYLFGNIPWVQENFGAMILGIILISLLPLAQELMKHYFGKARK
jgi:membrane-associated protein